MTVVEPGRFGPLAARDGLPHMPSWRTELIASGPGADPGDASAVMLRSNGDVAAQWEAGDRFHDVLDERCRRLGRRKARRQLAVDYGDYAYTFADLIAAANQLARYLDRRGVGPGSRIAVLVDRSIQSHAIVLAASKLGAAYVPLDPSFPADRVRFILADSQVDLVVTLDRFASVFSATDLEIVRLDGVNAEISKLSSHPFEAPGCRDQADRLAYIIYTSGTTGRPKGVPINHSSICNFVRIASEVYGYSEGDRVYQGMTIAFDFSVEELWVPLAAGATIVPAPSDTQLVGEELQAFLRSNRITALCCVPTQLATLEPRLPDLRLLLLSGEACPSDLVDRWLTDGRRVLNAYGPTETTVTATWKVLTAGGAVTIGGPLPTYAIVILDPDDQRALSAGEIGEIGVSGIGLTTGYLNRPERTEMAFIDDFTGFANNPTGRIYRTGDMGRINDENEIEYLGRIDTQVKIRGYRIELGEIEAVAREVDTVGQVVVHPCTRRGKPTELAAYVTPRAVGEAVDLGAVDAALRAELPAYMIPTYYEPLDELPLLPSLKVDRNALPEPSGHRFVDSGRPHVAPQNEREAELAELLADVLELESVSTDADFFDHLGANSLSMAQYVTAIRRNLGIKRVSMKQLYQNPTIAQLAELVESRAATGQKPRHRLLADSPSTAPGRSPEEAKGPGDERVDRSGSLPPATRPELPTASRYQVEPRVASTAAYITTGLAQFVISVSTAFLSLVVAVATFSWVEGATGILETYLRAGLAGIGLFFGYSGFFIVLKWLVIGRFTTAPIPLWSVGYLRFWVARTAVRANPLNLFAGTPLYGAYLRLLGANVGPAAVIMSQPPVCADLVTIGARTVIRSDVAMPGYTAHGGYLFPGTIEIGHDSLICEATTIDVDVKIGDNVELGTASAVLTGQVLADNSQYHGSPAEPTGVIYDRVTPRSLPGWHRVRYALMQILVVFLWSTPIPLLVVQIAAAIEWPGLAFAPWGGAVGDVVNLAALAAVIYLWILATALTGVLVMPRLYNRFFVAETAHRLWGVQHWLARSLTRSSNSRSMNILFGDSSMILYYLAAIGYDLKEATQTGSNFGVDQRHHSPFLCRFSRNTMVSDGLRMLNLEVSATSFHMRRVAMPADTYLGNNVFYPAEARVGPNCLIATKAAVPIEGPVRTDVGILGSPAFEIPRSVARDQRFDHYKQPGVIEGRLRAKLRSNLQTVGIYLLRNYVLIFLGLVYGLGSFRLFGVADEQDVVAIGGALTLTAGLLLVSGAAVSIYLERLMADFSRMKPLYCSLYDPRFWAHERFWKFNDNAFVRAFNGTPLKGPLLRLRGAIVGKRLYDDGAGLPEPPLMEIGDDCMLNVGAVAQSHSLEDGTFKSDHIRIGNSCTIGTGGFVHYGATMHDGSVLEADAFLMKGSVVETGTIWRGNPARDATVGTDLERDHLERDHLERDHLERDHLEQPVGAGDQ